MTRPPTPAAEDPPAGAATSPVAVTPPPPPPRITEPGIYALTEGAYQADPCPEPSLTATICKRICVDSPAHAWQAHPRLNPDAAEDHDERFDIGTAAHALLLEGEAGVTVINQPDWRKAEARMARDAAYKAGRIPLLSKHWTAVQAMVAAARVQLDRHVKDGGAGMFREGLPERVLVWRDDEVWCRARLDWLRPGAIDDYKTTGGSANPDSWSRSLFWEGIDIQAAWYLRGVKALTGEDAVFRFAVQETYPPYALAIVGLGPDALVLAEKRCLYALEQWRACRASNDWVGYPRKTCWAILPAAFEALWLEKELR